MVTKLTTIQVNHPDHRSVSSYVRTLLQLPVSDPRYAVDVHGTKCNFYVHDVLHVMGYPVAFMLAHDYIKLWRLAGGPLQPMGHHDAIANANLGCPTVFALLEPDDKHSHVGIVLPQTPPAVLADTLVSNVGSSVFYGRSMRWAIGAKDLARVEFFGAL